MTQDFHSIRRLPPYVFESVNRVKALARKNGADIIDLGMGNPDLPTPEHITSKLCENANKPRTNRYSASKGIPGLRKAQAAYYERRFGVRLNPETQVVATLGSKEGFANMAQAITAPGDVVLVPNPSYPIHAFGFLMAGGVIRNVPSTPGPDYFHALERAIQHSIPKPLAVIVCYPSNPTAEVADLDFYKDLVAFAKKHEIFVLSDIAYAEIFFDDPPPSILQAPGAFDVAVEFTSMSKTYSMPGWRVGFAVGNERLIGALARVKSYLDYGAFTPIQVAASAALNGPQDCVDEMRAIYKSRRDVLVDTFTRAGWAIPAPRASMFAWAPIPEKFRAMGSVEFAKLLVEKADVAVSPGAGFGEHGDDFVRIALVENEHRIRQAARNIRRFLETSDQTLHNVVPLAAARSVAANPPESRMAAALKVGVAGLGTVGASVVRILGERASALTASSGRPIQLTAVSARDKAKSRGLDLGNIRWHDDPAALAADDNVDLVVELIGGADGAAKTTVEAALRAGKPVVTANKALLAAHGLALAALAEEKNVTLAFEAAVAGGIPVIKTLREALPGSRLDRVSGILNGTCNYILTRMEEDGLSFADALADAQRLGYAEADPTFDIGGFDAAHKLAILTSLAFGTKIDADAIYIEGIQSISPLDLATADELGYRIKLLGVATRTDAGVEQRVHPTMVPKGAPLAQVMGVTNAVQICGSASDITLVGPGAGGDATASAVIADIVDVARGANRMPFGVPVRDLQQARRAPITTHQGGYYIRLDVVDRPGTAAAIATRMAEQQISLESILQRKPRDKKLVEATGTKTQTVPLVLITHATSEAAVRTALDAVLADGHIHGAPQVIRIEKDD